MKNAMGVELTESERTLVECYLNDKVTRKGERWSGSAAQSISKYEANSDCCPFSSKSIEGFSSLAAMWLGTMSSSSPIP